MNNFLTPEIMGALKTLAGFAGLDIITGAMHNKLIGRASIILKTFKVGLDAISILINTASKLIQQVQDYGNE